ncbi:unnamed protein product [Paramecium sonneborni]|uniref:Uncharacterized protein n=1 Tax=Paramecium sonneborni TaxID=65129 RepID=A0A8S1KLQ9_9CILI|nr:unnamed protein product [Paramecium sonneborni]
MNQESITNTIVFSTGAMVIDFTNLNAEEIFNLIYIQREKVETAVLNRLIQEYLEQKEELHKLKQNIQLEQQKFQIYNIENIDPSLDNQNSTTSLKKNLYQIRNHTSQTYNKTQGSNENLIFPKHRKRIQTQKGKTKEKVQKKNLDKLQNQSQIQTIFQNRVNLNEQLNQRQNQSISQFKNLQKLVEDQIQNLKPTLRSENIYGYPEIDQQDILQYRLDINNIKNAACVVHSQWQEFVEYIKSQYKSVQYKQP